VEPLYQNESLLILKGDRPATVTLSQNGHTKAIQQLLSARLLNS
jgi:hypothetical protein